MYTDSISVVHKNNDLGHFKNSCKSLFACSSIFLSKNNNLVDVNVSASFESIGTMLAAAETPLFAADEAKKALIGLARDLRGLAFAFNTKTSYMMLFDWM